MSAAQTTEPTRSTSPGRRFAGLQVLDVQRVLAEAGRVGGVGQPAAIAGDVGCADVEEGVALGQLVAVEDDLFRRIVLRPGSGPAPAAVDGVLQSLFRARAVPPAAVAEGNRDVGLLHMREHLLVEVVAQAGKRGHHRLGVGVFGLEIRGHLGVLFVAQPGVVVHQDCAMQRCFFVFLAGDGRLVLQILVHFFSSVVQRQLLAAHRGHCERIASGCRTAGAVQ